MKISDKLLKKLKSQFPEQCCNIRKIYRVYGLNDGVSFKWTAFGIGETEIFSYDTMTDCLKNEIIIECAIFNGEYRGWLVGVKG